jgi:transposase
MAEAPLIKTFRSGATGLIRSLCNEIKLVEHINHVVTWDEKQWKVSPGQHILALIINTLCGRSPLYRVEQFYEDQDVEGLFGVERTAHDFNHFALGRALDAFYEAGSKSIFTALTLRNLLTGSAALQFAHGDTTSKVMYGDYEDKGDPNTLKITQGYSKDKRFDLKQIVMGLVTIGRGMPLLGNVNDGNLDDKTWNGQLVDTMARALNPDQIRQLVYVADSAFFTETNVKNAHRKGLRFISLVSENHKLRKNCIEQVLQNPQMTSLGCLSDQKNASEYHLQEISQDYHGIPLRCSVVYSTHLAKQKKETLARQLQKEQSQLAKVSEELGGLEFACTKDAHIAWEKFEHTQRKSSFPISSTIQSLTRPKRRDKRGRPKKDETQEMETVYTLEIKIAPVPPELIEEQERRMGYFVLATNHNDASELSAAQVLREYKQQSSVELRFKFLKDPMFVDSLFLKTPERIEALGYVLLIALFIYMTLEERIRTAVQQQNVRLQPVRGWHTSKPTAKQVILMLEHIVTIYWYDRETDKWQKQMQQNDKAQQLFDLLKVNPYDCSD